MAHVWRYGMLAEILCFCSEGKNMVLCMNDSWLGGVLVHHTDSTTEGEVTSPCVSNLF